MANRATEFHHPQKRKRNMKKLGFVFAAVVLLAASVAHASITIDYNVAGLPPTTWGGANDGDLNHDAMTVNPYSGTGLLLPDNTPVTATINTMDATIYYTSVQGQIPFSGNRDMTITVPAGGTNTLTQSFTLDSWMMNYPNDTIFALSGATSSFTFAGIGTVDVTPDKQTFVYANGSYTENLTATFLFTPIPEPSTLIVWSLLGSLAVGLGWWRNRKAA